MKSISRFPHPALLLVVALAWSASAAAEVVASAGWAEATKPGSDRSAAYLVLTNKGDEKRSLLRITSPVSDKVMLHMTSVDAEGGIRNWPVASLELEPGQSIRFEPFGRHVTFMELKAPLVAGRKVPLVLQFDGWEEALTVELEIR